MRGRSRLLLAFFTFVVLSPAVLVLSPALADAPGWELYTHPDKLMSVRFPGKPTESVQKGPSPDGNGIIHLKIATFVDVDRAFVATAVIYPETIKFDVETALDGALDKMLARFKGHVVAKKSITVDGLQGRDVQFAAPGPYNKPLRCAARIVASMKPPSSYLAMAMQMDGNPDPDARKFLDSLHLGKNVETRP